MPKVPVWVCPICEEIQGKNIDNEYFFNCKYCVGEFKREQLFFVSGSIAFEHLLYRPDVCNLNKENKKKITEWEAGWKEESI